MQLNNNENETCPHNSQVLCGQCRLNKICIPLALDAGDVDKLDAIVQRGRLLQKGQYLYRQSEHFESIYAVRSGSFKSYSVSSDGQEQVTGFYFPGEILGMDGISEECHMSSAVALETASICEIPFNDLTSLSRTLPSLQRHFFQLMSQEIIDDQRLFSVLSKSTADQRVAALLLSISARNARRQLSGVNFRLPMSRADVGNYLGLTVETISRVLGRFQKDKLLCVNNKEITIQNLDALQMLVDKA